jgi:hypothetical protein
MDDQLEKIPNIPIGGDGNETVFSDDLVGYILQELERRRDDRAGLELQWGLNSNFLAGHQNCDINMVSRTIQREDNVMTTDMERRVYNRISPLIETRHANLKSINYDMIVNPRTVDLDDLAKAKVGTKILEYCQSVTDFNAKKDKLIAWAELTGTAFTLSYWDPDGGEVIGYIDVPSADENGMPLVERKAVKSGEIAFGLVSSYEVFPASLLTQEIKDQPNIIIEQVWDTDKVYDVYGIHVEGESVEQYVLTPIESAMTGHGVQNSVMGVARETVNDAVRVVTYIENPSRDYPRGRYIVVVRDKIVYYTDIPAGINPLVAFKSKTVAGQFFGKSVIQDLIPLQRAYNKVVNKIHDYIDTLANNGWLVPEGSIVNEEEIAENGIESGATLVYNANFGKPELVVYPNPPSVVINERNQLSSDMEYVAGVSQLMVYGDAPSGITSGVAIENLRNIDSTRMSLTGDNIRDGVVEMAKIWLRLNKRYSVGYRTLQIAGSDDIGYAYTWSADDINSYDVELSAENELRYSKDQQRADFLQLHQMGMFTDDNGRLSREFKRKAWEMFRIGNFDDVMSMDEAQVKYARRENTFLEQGVIPTRTQYDDDAIHLEEHKRYAISMDFKILQKNMPEYAKKFDEHIAVHQSEIQKKQAEAMRMSMMMSAKNGGNT